MIDQILKDIGHQHTTDNGTKCYYKPAVILCVERATEQLRNRIQELERLSTGPPMEDVTWRKTESGYTIFDCPDKNYEEWTDDKKQNNPGPR